MTITIQTINTDISTAERQRFRRRLKKLETFSKRILQVEAQLVREKKDPVSGYHCSLYLSRPGADFFSRAKKGSFDEALGHAAEGLRKQLRKAKTNRLQSLRKTIRR